MNKLSNIKPYNSSLKYVLKDYLRGVFFALVFSPLIYVYRPNLKIELFLFSIFGVILILLFYLILKFLIKGIKSVSLSETSVVFNEKTNSPKLFRWEDFNLISNVGGGWKFETKNHNIILREDGFTSNDFLELSNIIQQYRVINKTDLIKTDFNNEIIFEPIYSKNFYVIRLGGFVFTILGWFMLLSRPTNIIANIEIFISILIFSGIFLYLPFVVAKKIKLGNSLLIERYIFSFKRIEYSMINDVTSFALYTERGKFPINNMKNAYVLIELIENKLKSLGFYEGMIEGKYAKKEYFNIKASIISFPISFFIYLIIPIFGIAELLMFPMFTLLGIFSIIYICVLLIIKHKEKDNLVTNLCERDLK